MPQVIESHLDGDPRTRTVRLRYGKQRVCLGPFNTGEEYDACLLAVSAAFRMPSTAGRRSASAALVGFAETLRLLKKLPQVRVMVSHHRLGTQIALRA